MAQATALLREFGFPVVVAVWFMWRLEKRLDRLAELMTSLLMAIRLLAQSIDFHILPPKVGGTPPPPEDVNP
jgi:hypothetical protein